MVTLHESVQECIDVHTPSINELIGFCKGRINPNGTLHIAPNITPAEFKLLGKTLVQSMRVSTLEHYRAIGYWWIECATEKHGGKKQNIIDMFGHESLKEMYTYFSTRGSICRYWDGAWNDNRSWDWHKSNDRPDKPRRKYVRHQEEVGMTDNIQDAPDVDATQARFSVKALLIGRGNTYQDLSFTHSKGLRGFYIKDENGNFVEGSICAADFFEPVTAILQDEKRKDIERLERSGKITLYRNRTAKLPKAS